MVNVDPNSSILNTIRLLVTSFENDKAFDNDLMSYITASAFNLNAIGIGKIDLMINENTTWLEFMGQEAIDAGLLYGASSYVSMFVRTLFDPPQSSYVLESMKKTTDQLYWLVTTLADNLYTERGVINGISK